ncbi:hypothetical protein [Ensifer sp. ZNC0028]|uniref:hypothetical protein n=1 Tax=Ensifer sp. ZNC0028 TaxID=1339236 RepID=UPI003528304E
MNSPLSQPSTNSTPKPLGVEFAQSVDAMPVARVGDLVFAMVPARDNRYSSPARGPCRDPTIRIMVPLKTKRPSETAYLNRRYIAASFKLSLAVLSA